MKTLAMGSISGYCFSLGIIRVRPSSWRSLPPNGSEARGSSGLLTTDKGGADSSTVSIREPAFDPLWTPEQVAQRLNVSPDWVRDHSSRKEPRLPVIRLGGGPGRAGLLRYRVSQIEKFIEEMESLSRRHFRRI